MSIKRTVVLSLIVTYFIPTLVVGGLFIALILENFEQVEIRVMHERMSNLQRDFERELEHLAVMGRDWGHWDDSVAFISDPSSLEMRSWLLDFATLKNAGVTELAYFSPSGQVVFSAKVDNATESVEELASDRSQALSEILRRFPVELLPQSQRTGAVSLYGSPHIIGIVPVFPTDLSGSNHGFLVLAREMSGNFWRELQPGDSLSIVPRVEVATLGGPEKHVLVSAELLQGTLSLLDPDGKSQFEVAVESPRNLFRVAVSNQRYYYCFLFLFAAIAVAISYVLLNKLVVQKLNSLKDQAREIATKQDFSARVEVQGCDEIKSFTQSLNLMLEGLENAHREITEAKERAERANRAKVSFISKVSHELRSPLFAILSNLRLFKKEELNSEAQGQLHVIEESSEGLLGVVNDILDFTEAASTVDVVEREEVEIRSFLLEIPRSFSSQLLKKADIILSIEVAQDIPTHLVIAPKLVRQLLVHLISNAIKFSERGSIVISVVRLGHSLVLKVEDTGIGMAPEQLSRLAEPFSQIEETSNRRHQGLGLGLTLIRRIVASLSGRIEIESNVGEGTAVSVHLPDVVRSDTSIKSLPKVITIFSSANNELPEGSEQKLKVLVADQKQLNRVLMKGMLEAAGHSVVCLKNGEELLKVLQQSIKAQNNLSENQKAFDLVLANSEMPVYSGMEILKLTREAETLAGRSACQRIPIVIFGPEISQDQEKSVLDMGGNGFLSKPISAEKLAAVVQLINPLE